VYQQHLAARQRVQTVLIGYSESNHESGIVASRLAAYRAQRILTAALDRAHERHVLFYSRGGSIPRGGGRIDTLLRAAPAESVSGVLRFTEQGEGIAQHFGLRANAMRTLERSFNTLALATLAVRRGVAVQESAAFADAAAHVAAESRAAWRRLLEGPGFYEFFRAATPIDVIERMRIGGQHGREAPAVAGIEGVPAAAWVYAWSQSRHMLPGWYGAGSGLDAARSQRGLGEIAACYDQLAAAELSGCALAIRNEFSLTSALVCEIKESRRLLDADRTLQRSIALRNPYVDPMNLMQVDLLRRWRAGGRSDAALLGSLLTSVAGIGSGLQTTG
jgi:phosphoenolpyruvate carboxylase